MALGNTVVLKPSSDTPVTGGLLLAKIYEEAGLPKGVLNVIVSRGNAIGDAFVHHPIPRVLSFTGSTKVGKRIAELAATGEMLKRVTLELGGNSPILVLGDAHVELAVRIATFGKFLHQGQICMAVNRLIVHAKIHDRRRVLRHRKWARAHPPARNAFARRALRERSHVGSVDRGNGSTRARRERGSSPRDRRGVAAPGRRALRPRPPFEPRRCGPEEAVHRRLETLRDTDEKVESIAGRLGYESVAAKGKSDVRRVDASKPKRFT